MSFGSMVITHAASSTACTEALNAPASGAAKAVPAGQTLGSFVREPKTTAPKTTPTLHRGPAEA